MEIKRSKVKVMWHKNMPVSVFIRKATRTSAVGFPRVTSALPMLLTTGFSMDGAFRSQQAMVWVMVLVRVLTSSSLGISTH